MNTNILKVIIGGLIVILIAIGIVIAINANSNASSKVTIGNHTFSVSVVKSQKDQEIGLSGRNSIADTQGMLFLFTKPDYYTFWMRDMKFPLDIVFIRNNKIVTIFQNTPKPQDNQNVYSLPLYKPIQFADMVLEMNAGLTQKDTIKIGDTVKISL